jgi:hypothetical protein
VEAKSVISYQLSVVSDLLTISERVEGRKQKAEGRKQKAEGRKQKAEGRKQKAEGRKQLFNYSVTPLFSYSVLRFCVFTCLTVFLGVFVNAQTSVKYGYDAAGNRTNRTIIMQAPPAPPQDSTEIIIEDEGDVFVSVPDIENGEESPQEIYTDVLSEALITIYPNPTRGLLTVKMSNMPRHVASSLALFDIQGRIVTQQQSLSDENKLDISAQPVGTYVMRIVVGNEAVGWKIVKSEL